MANPESINVKFIRNVSTECMERGATITTLANRSGIPEEMLYAIMNKKLENIDLKTLEAIANALGVTYDYLLR